MPTRETTRDTPRTPLIVSIDTERDASPTWRNSSPLGFRGIAEGVGERLHPLFAEHGVRPTYLLSPEIITHRESAALLAGLADCELGTHLHGDCLAPGVKSLDPAGLMYDEMQWEYAPDVERAKLATLTELFAQQFGRRPRSFRAGRFGVGHHSGRILAELGYDVESSVTPHVVWTSRTGVRRPDFRGLPEYPYAIGDRGDIWTPGPGRLLEVPVTVLAPGAVPGGGAGEPVWFRPWYSDAATLAAVARHVARENAGRRHPRPLVMMFHNVEVVAGASPYPQSAAEVERYLDMLRRTFDLIPSLGLVPQTLAEYYDARMADARASREAPDETRGETAVSVRPTPAAAPAGGAARDIVGVGAAAVDAAVDRHATQAWFKYIFRERATRWDVWRPCAWVAEQYGRDARVLSTGCGMGFNLVWLAEQGFTRLEGFDVDPKAVAAGQELCAAHGLPVRLWRDDGVRPARLGGGPYDVIEALNWMMYAPAMSPERLLDVYLPRLADGGALVFDAIDASYDAMPGNEWLTSDWSKPEAERRPSEYVARFAEERVRRAAAERGLAVAAMFAEPGPVPRKVYVVRRAPVAAAAPTPLPDAGVAAGRAPRLVAGGSRPRALLIADVPGWIFERHARTLATRLGDEFDCTVAFLGERYDEDAYDLIYPLEFPLAPTSWIRTPAKYVTAIRSHVSWAQYGAGPLSQYLAAHFAQVHVVSRRLHALFAPHLPDVRCVSHGIDTRHFTPTTRADQSGPRLRLGWAGNRQTAAKGFEEFVAPLGRLPGVELVFCGYSDRNLTLDEMRGFYDSLDAYVCTSATEGNNNSLMEAAAMARAIVTTDAGTVPEYLAHGASALVVPRDAGRFAEAVATLRDDPGLRRTLGAAARAAAVTRWDWRARAEDYRAMFREVVEGGVALRG